eukprot:TRINITY_DN5716_c0_g1_i1.p1 TRINITY_DN5716_c0_g1~~TRINITY_DN5716_c0_g1_i1.p1  ORF type:complete len:433 (+),score=159.09 TRINITY_DN5716_c0_g1_i1:79-1377(+)
MQSAKDGGAKAGAQAVSAARPLPTRPGPAGSAWTLPRGSILDVESAERKGGKQSTSVMALGLSNFEVLAKEQPNAAEQEVASMVNRMVHWVAFTESVRGNGLLLAELEDFQRECWDKEQERERVLRSDACRAPAAQLRRRQSVAKPAAVARPAAPCPAAHTNSTTADSSAPPAAVAGVPPVRGRSYGERPRRPSGDGSDVENNPQIPAVPQSSPAARRGLLPCRGKGPASATSLGAELMYECQGIGAGSSREHGFVTSTRYDVRQPSSEFSFAAALPSSGPAFAGSGEGDLFSRKLQELQWLQSETVRQERGGNGALPQGSASKLAAAYGPASASSVRVSADKRQSSGGDDRNAARPEQRPPPTFAPQRPAPQPQPQPQSREPPPKDLPPPPSKTPPRVREAEAPAAVRRPDDGDDDSDDGPSSSDPEGPAA